MTHYLVHTPFGFRSGIKAGDIVAVSDEDAPALIACGAIERTAGKMATAPVSGTGGTLGPVLEGKRFAELVAIAADEGLALDPKIKSKAAAIAAIIAHRTTDAAVQGQAPA